MNITLQKLQKHTNELEPYRYVGMQDISPITIMEAAEGPDEVHRTVPEVVEGGEISTGEFFSGRDKYWWTQKKLTLPEEKRGMTPIGLFDFGKTDVGNNDGFEGLIYLNGNPYQAIDGNHHEVVISKEFAGEPVDMKILLWSGLEGGGEHRIQYHQVHQMEMGYLHEDTDAFYYFCKAIYMTLNLLPESDPNFYGLLQAADEAFALIDWDKDAFYDTIGKALRSLTCALDRMEKNSSVTVSCVGHTHIDVAWLWRLKNTREKAMRSFSTVLRLMEEFDEYVFMQSTPQLYEYVKEDCPYLYEKIKKRVAESRWEADGAMWLEADCNVTSGESLSRQLLEGDRFFKNEFGVKCRALWLPDVFGYSWALPQLLRQSGIDTFMTTKISWNKYNTMPNDLFRWKGIDGTEILTYFINTPDPAHEYTSHFATYNGDVSPHSVLGSWEKFKNKDITKNTLISYGFGDGGGGPTRNMLKMRRAMDRLPGLPNVKASTAGEFFDTIHKDAEKAGDRTPVWDGELYLELHRGTYTSQGYNKKMNRRMENALCQAEWISTLSYVLWDTYEEKSLEDAWKIVLRNQFHDIIPGSSIREVYEDSRREYAEAEGLMETARDASLQRLQTPSGDSYTLYNFSSFQREEAVWVPETKDGHFVDSEGNVLTCVRRENGYFVRVKVLPLSCAIIRLEPGVCEEKKPTVVVEEKSRQVVTPYYRVRWGVDGALEEIYDCKANRQVLAKEARGNCLMVYEDRPTSWDAWDVDEFCMDKGVQMTADGAPELVENSALRTVLRFGYTHHDSKLTQDMILYPDSPRIDFVTHVDWHESRRLLKVLFPVNIRSTKATYEIQYGHVERPTHRNTSWDRAKFEVVGHRWADLSQANYGVSLLNDCKYGYSVHENLMTLSLLRSPKYPDPQADMGEHEFTYSIMAHEGAVTEGDTIPEAMALNQPIFVSKGETTLENCRIFKTDCPDIVIDAVKKAKDADGVVVRFHEYKGGDAKGTLSSDMEILRYAPANLLEEPTGPEMKEKEIPFELHPFEVRTVLVWFR